MNIQKARIGHSFKGAFVYYFHDKRRDGEAHPLTADRVAWAEGRNLASDDPAFALSVMIATARSADELKRAAGVKATGRKATTGPVYALSLAWHPDAAGPPDRAEMVRAADQVLELLEARHLQAMIVAHTDTAHPHVHIIINRIDPATGKAVPFSNDLHKLDAWADRYERQRGQIVSPNRARKHDERRARQAAGDRPAAGRPQRVPRAQVQPDNRATLLAEQQAAQRERHRQEWDDYRAQAKAERAEARAERLNFKAIAAAHRAEQRPEWSVLGRRQTGEKRAFKANEKRLAGIVRNAINVVKSQQIRGLAEDRGFLAMCFNFTFNAKARHQAFADRQAAEKADLAKRGEALVLHRFDQARAGKAEKLAALAQVQGKRRADLIARQDTEKAAMRESWRQLYAERGQGPRTGRQWPRPAAKVLPAAEARPQPAFAQAVKPVPARRPGPPLRRPAPPMQEAWQRTARPAVNQNPAEPPARLQHQELEQATAPPPTEAASTEQQERRRGRFREGPRRVRTRTREID